MPLLIIFLIYNIFQLLLLPLIAFYFFYRKFFRHDAFGCWQERIGIIPKATKEVFWIHAVSVGEVFSIQYLIAEIKKNHPNLACYLTVGTSAGKNIAQQNCTGADYISFMPYDFLPFVLLAFCRIRPRKIIFVEAEIWPNFLILSSWFNIDKTLINARISSRSYPRYKRLKLFFGPIFNSFKKILTQSPSDSDRFVKIGVRSDIISVFGDIKAFNVVQKRHSVSESQILKLPLQKNGLTTLLVGSIHPGELVIYLKMFLSVRQSFAGLRMILAPRHFNWTQELQKKLNDSGLKFICISDKDKFDLCKVPDLIENFDIVVFCRLGVLFDLYQFADIFYLGGTFVNIGGHNLLEPAAWSNPCIVGPFYQNTKSNADEMELAGGLLKVEDLNQLEVATQKILSDKNLQAEMGEVNNLWVRRKSDIISNKISSI